MTTCADTQCAFMLANRWLEIWWSLVFLSQHAFCEKLVEELNGLGLCGMVQLKMSMIRVITMKVGWTFLYELWPG